MTPLEYLKLEFVNNLSKATRDFHQKIALSYIEKAYELGHEQGEIFAKGDSLPHTHTDNPFVRVVVKETTKTNEPGYWKSRMADFIQKICPECGTILSEVEIQSR